MIHPHSETLIEIVLEIWGSAIHSSGLKEMCVSIRQLLGKLMDTTNFCICHYTPEKDTLTMLYRVDRIDPVDNYEHYYVEQVSQSDMLIAKVIRNGRPLLIHKDEDLEQARRAGKKIIGTPAEVWLGVPLKIKDTLQGVIVVQSYDNPDQYSRQEKDLLEVLSGPIAAALAFKKMEEAQIRDEAIKQTLFRIANAVNLNLDLNDLYQSIHQSLKRVIDLPNFFIGFHNKQKGTIDFPYLVDEVDYPHVDQTILQTQNEEKYSLNMLVIQSGAPLRLNKEKILKLSREAHKETIGTVPEIWLGFPLKIKDEIIGVMGAQSYTNPFHFSEKDIEILNSVSDQIAIAIDRKRADENAHKRAERLAVINRIGKVAAFADNLEKLMEAIYEEIKLIYKPDAFFIAFFDKKSDELEFRFHVNSTRGKEPVTRRHLEDGFCAKVIKERMPLIVRNYEQEKHLLPKQIVIGDQRTALSWVGVPIMFEDQIIGVVSIQAYKPYAWNEEDIQLFFTIADQIAGTIAKARIFEDANRRAGRLAVLNRIGMLAASAQNIDQMINNIYEEINTIFKPDAFFIAFYHEKTDELEFKILVDEDQKSENQRVSLGKGLSEKIIAEKRPLVINHYEKEKSNLPRQMTGGKRSQGSAQSWIGVPLMFAGELIGIVNIQSYTPNAWNQEDQQLFFTIADQIGAVIQKARLYESVQQELNERKKAEDENKKLEFQLRQAQKMEAIGTLAGGIAHDFNNVLYPIIGFTEMTMDLVPNESLAKKNLDEILTAADRAKDLIRQILTFSRQQEYNPQPLRIQPILKEALKLMRSSMPTTISIIQDIEETCGPVLADPSQIHQIIMNLCTNAYQAMRKQGGILEVALSEIDVKPGQGDKTFRLYPGLYLCLTVRDTGHGIDPLIMERIFDPYFTTKPPGEGTGMGLALVHGIVKSYGGETVVTSQPGKGATFQVYFPRIMEAEEEAINTLPKCVPGQGERILFVDDEEQIVIMVDQMLQSLNYKVVTKKNSLEALEEFSKKPDGFDLIITDQTMPGLTGFDLAKRMLAIRPGMPIILCTGYSELVNEEQVKAAGIRKFILKPILKSQLSMYLREILDESEML